MPNKWMLAGITIMLLLGMFLGGKYVMDIVIGNACGNDMIQKSSSPDGKKAAYMFRRNCGATTGYSYQLSILDKDDPLENTKGNTFMTEKEFSVEWVNEKKLEVIYDKSFETYEMDKRVKGVKVKYIGK